MDAERWTRRFLLAGLLWVAVGLGVLGWVASAHARLPGFQTCLEEKAFYEKGTGVHRSHNRKILRRMPRRRSKNAAEEAREHEERGAEEEARAAKEAKREARKAAREARLTREAHMRRPTVHRRQAELGVKRLLRREVWTWPGAYSTLACRRQFRTRWRCDATWDWGFRRGHYRCGAATLLSRRRDPPRPASHLCLRRLGNRLQPIMPVGRGRGTEALAVEPEGGCPWSFPRMSRQLRRWLGLSVARRSPLPVLRMKRLRAQGQSR